MAEQQSAQQMSPARAVEILDKATQNVSGDRNTHALILRAIQVLHGLAKRTEEQAEIVKPLGNAPAAGDVKRPEEPTDVPAPEKKS